MNKEPPEGSKIRIDRTMYATRYLWENKERNLFGYAIAAPFLLFLCVWTYGATSIIGDIIGESRPLAECLDALSRLLGWVLCEATLIAILYFILRPKKPSVVTLHSGRMEYQSGTRALEAAWFSRERSESLFALCRRLRNNRYSVKNTQSASLKLERVGDRQRLSFDHRGQLIEIGQTLSEPEREWLYAILQQHMQENPDL